MPNKKGLLFKPKAEEDLELIYVYTESNWGIKQAEKYLDQLHGSMTVLLNYPEAGVIYRTATNTYRKLVVGNHVIYYRYSDRQVIIIRILHFKMNRDNWL